MTNSNHTDNFRAAVSRATAAPSNIQCAFDLLSEVLTHLSQIGIALQDHNADAPSKLCTPHMQEGGAFHTAMSTTLALRQEIQQSLIDLHEQLQSPPLPPIIGPAPATFDHISLFYIASNKPFLIIQDPKRTPPAASNGRNGTSPR